MWEFIDVRQADRRRAFAQPLAWLLPTGFTVIVAVGYLKAGGALDFHHQFRPAGVQVLHGLDPYAPRFQHLGIKAGDYAFPYTPFTALAFTPMALLSSGVADAVFTAVTVLALLGTLWLLDVRDIRIYGVVLIWEPTVSLYQVANLTSILTLGTAIMWRWRAKPSVQGIVLGVVVTLKVFIWPLGLWLLFTRRFLAVGWALGTVVVINTAAFAVVGFDRLDGYRRVTTEITKIMESRGYSIASVVLHVGGDRTAAYLLTGLVGAVCVAGCFVAARRQREREALTFAVATTLAASPVVWTHYFVLLVVPLALAAPMWRRIWLLPLLFWACPPTKPHDAPRIIGVVVLVLVFAAILRMLRADPTPRRGDATSAFGTDTPRGNGVPAVAPR